MARPVNVILNPIVVELNANPIAIKGDKGDKGDNFVSTFYEVNNPATTWTIIHNKGYYPSITVLDTFDREVIVEIEHNNLNQVTIKFEMLFSGKVVVN